jgi:predicted enzyme related to lactoylglutathione lyase
LPARVAHFEIQGPNDEQTAAFYRDLLDWPTDPRGPGYTLIDPAAAGLGGAIADTPEGRAVLSVTVSDLDATIAHAAELAGEVLMPATDIGLVHQGAGHRSRRQQAVSHCREVRRWTLR